MNASTIREYTHSKINASQEILQLHSNVHRVDSESESATVEYSSIESFQDHLMKEAISCKSVFEAVRLIHDAQRLNGGKRLLNDKDMVEIKKHFRKKELLHSEGNEIAEKEIVKSQNRDFLKNELSKSINGKSNSPIAKGESIGKGSIHSRMVKGYLNILSEQARI